MKERIWELDFSRGLSIILMIMFHIIVLLTDYFTYNIDYTKGFWYLEGKVSAIMFIIIAGISSTISKNNIKRGAVIFFFGMTITLATFIFSPEYFVKFGILHFLGLSIILYTFIRKLNYKLLVALSFVSIYIGSTFAQNTVTSSYLFPIGLTNNHFSSMDYYPILPWFGVFLFGAILKISIFKNTRGGNPPLVLKPLSYIGKHSLIIYLIHQPILFGLFYLVH